MPKINLRRIVSHGIEIHKQYQVVIVNPFSRLRGNYKRHEMFEKEFIRIPGKMFGIPGEEKNILHFFNNCPYVLDVTQEVPEILKLEEDIYYNEGIQSFYSSDHKKEIELDIRASIDFKECENWAFKNLLRVVSEDLSPGDKLLVRNIAVDSFHKTLEVTLDPKNIQGSFFPRCLGTHMHEYALNKLNSFGFKIHNPVYKDIDLRPK